MEGELTDAREAGGQLNRRQRGAGIEGVLTNAREAGGQRDREDAKRLNAATSTSKPPSPVTFARLGSPRDASAASAKRRPAARLSERSSLVTSTRLLVRARPTRAHSRAHAQDAPRPRAPREAHALERAQRQHVGTREGVLEGVLVDELRREPAHWRCGCIGRSRCSGVMLSVVRVNRLLRRCLPLHLGGEVAHDTQQPPELRATLAGEVTGAQGTREEVAQLVVHVEKVPRESARRATAARAAQESTPPAPRHPPHRPWRRARACGGQPQAPETHRGGRRQTHHDHTQARGCGSSQVRGVEAAKRRVTQPARANV